MNSFYLRESHLSLYLKDLIRYSFSSVTYLKRQGLDK
nr:MAG TPA: hypothetical protein [Caudoviricetes sp.]